MTIVAVIPAHLASRRAPRKLLAEIEGEPLLWHGWRRVCTAGCFDAVCIATDAEEIRSLGREWGADVRMTSADVTSGTERIASIAGEFDASHFVNIQADMPWLDPRMLCEFVRVWQERAAPLITPVYRIHTTEELLDPHLVKVARADSGLAVYFSRHPVPFLRDVDIGQWLSTQAYWAHIGVYGYERTALETYLRLPHGILERAERLEQLRYLEAGIAIDTYASAFSPRSIDSLPDLQDLRKRESCKKAHP